MVAHEVCMSMGQRNRPGWRRLSVLLMVRPASACVRSWSSPCVLLASVGHSLRGCIAFRGVWHHRAVPV